MLLLFVAESLDLADLGLDGTIPTEIGDCRKLGTILHAMLLATNLEKRLTHTHTPFLVWQKPLPFRTISLAEPYQQSLDNFSTWVRFSVCRKKEC